MTADALFFVLFCFYLKQKEYYFSVIVTYIRKCEWIYMEGHVHVLGIYVYVNTILCFLVIYKIIFNHLSWLQ